MTTANYTIQHKTTKPLDQDQLICLLVDALEEAKDQFESLEDAGHATARDKRVLNKIYRALRQIPARGQQ